MEPACPQAGAESYPAARGRTRHSAWLATLARRAASIAPVDGTHYIRGMHITMVKKRLADGHECPKCAQATRELERRGVWNKIDEVVWSDESDATSPGSQLAAQHNVDRAPFFIVKDDRGEQVYTSVMRLISDRL
jgi:hypothetical protein